MNNYSHLYISHIKRNARKRTGRDKGIPGLSRHEHGQVLSAGIKRILDRYRNLISTKDNGLESKGIASFKVVLQTREKIDNSARRAFLEKQGFTIHAIKSPREVIVTAPVENVIRVSKKLNEYIAGKRPEFQYIESFGRVLPREKMSYGFFEETKRTQEKIDSQIMLLPNLPKEIVNDMISNVQGLIEEDGGQMLSHSLKLTDGTPILRANLDFETVEKIANEDSVFRIEETTVFSDLVESSIPEETFPNLSLDSKIDISSLPIVVVLDSGVRFPTIFDDLVVDHCDFTGNGDARSQHGTEVSSRVIFGELGEQIQKGILTPRARVIDCHIIEETANSYDIIERIQNAVEKYHNISPIFNLSINETSHCISDDQVSVFGYELDQLSNKYGIQFVVSAGNHFVWETGASLADCINNTNSRICSPAESFNAITVGAVSNIDQPKNDFYKKFLTKYSRRGPGFVDNRKPDIVGIAGSIYLDSVSGTGRTFEEPGAFVLGFDGAPHIASGTSFSTPEAAGTFASIYSSLPVFSNPKERNLMAKTLLLHGAEKLIVPSNFQACLNYRDYYLFGCGLINLEKSLFSNEKNATYCTLGKINKGEKIVVPFHIPSVLEKNVTGKNKVLVKVTCCADASTSKAAGPNYLEEYVSVSLHRNSRTGKQQNGNPNWRNSFRLKWTPYIQYENAFTNFSSGEWQIWLELFDRANHDKDQNVSFALAVSVVEQIGDFNIYSEILKETVNLYIPLSVLVQERTKIKI